MKRWTFIVALVGLCSGSAFLGYLYHRLPNQLTHGDQGTVTIGGPFSLIDHTGRARTQADFRGKWMLVYFGYTYCPDICPAALYHMSQALQQLGQYAKLVQPLFITIDPERDTVPHLARYIESYHPQFIALTGTKDQIAAAGEAYRVYFARASEDRGANDYLMDHSSIVYLMNPEGEFVTHFNHETPADEMAQALQDILTSSSVRH
ncbi:MAG: SCO family protein [Holosporales bacterium]